MSQLQRQLSCQITAAAAAAAAAAATRLMAAASTSNFQRPQAEVLPAYPPLPRAACGSLTRAGSAAAAGKPDAAALLMHPVTTSLSQLQAAGVSACL
jgi:hypothetical protein